MKVNLLTNSNDVRSDYLNIDGVASGEGKTFGNVANLDWYVDDAECVDLLALDVIDYLPAPTVGDVITGWITKLRHGGTITVGGVDIREVAKSLVSQQIGPGEANALLYGGQTAPWEYRKSTRTMQEVIQIFQDATLKVMRKQIDGHTYYVTARRP